MDGRERLVRATLGIERSRGVQVIAGAVIGCVALAVALPAAPDWQVWLLGFRGRLSMTMLAVTMSAWAGYETDGLLPGLAPAVGLAAGLLVGGAWVLVTLGILWGIVVGGFGLFLGVSLRRYRGVSG